MKKTIIYIMAFLSITLLFSTGYASGESVPELTISKAQELAVENSRQVLIDDLEIKAKESNLEKVRKDAASVGNAFDPARVLSNRITKYVSPMRAETELEVAKRAKEDNIRQLKLNVYRTMTDLMLAEEELAKEKVKFGILERKYEIEKARYDLGIITESSLTEMKFTLESRQADIDSIEDKIKTLNLELKKLLNLALDDTPIKINEELKLDELKNFDLEDAIVKAIGKNTHVFRMEQEFKANEKIMELTKELFDEGHAEYDERLFNYELAKADLEKAKRDLEVSIRNKYNDLLSAYDDLELSKAYEKLVQKRLNLVEEKFKNGLANEVEVLDQKEALEDAKFQITSNIARYNKIKQELFSLL